MKKAVVILSLLLAISAALNIIYIRARAKGGAATDFRPDTVRITDTMRFISPAHTRDTIIRYVRVGAFCKTPAPDNPGNPANPGTQQQAASAANTPPADTAAAVLLPITQRTYTAPEYTAYVSGYLPSLDSITLHTQRTVITQPPPAAKNKPWSIGIAAGVGAGRGGLTPFIGITLQYSLIRF